MINEHVVGVIDSMTMSAPTPVNRATSIFGAGLAGPWNSMQIIAVEKRLSNHVAEHTRRGVKSLPFLKSIGKSLLKHRYPTLLSPGGTNEVASFRSCDDCDRSDSSSDGSPRSERGQGQPILKRIEQSPGPQVWPGR